MVALSYLELNEEIQSLILPRECGHWFPMPASAGVLLDVTAPERIPLTSTRWFISYPLCGLTFASFAGGGGWSWRSDYSHTVSQAELCSLMDVLLLSCKSSILWDGTSDKPLDVVVGGCIPSLSLDLLPTDDWTNDWSLTSTLEISLEFGLVASESCYRLLSWLLQQFIISPFVPASDKLIHLHLVHRIISISLPQKRHLVITVSNTMNKITTTSASTEGKEASSSKE